MIKLAISPGDPAGIGPDICIKAFGLKKNLDFIPVIFGDISLFESRSKALGINIEIKEYRGQKGLDSNAFWVFHYPLDKKVIPGQPDTHYGKLLIKILQDATNLTKKNEFQALVTGPINKELMNQSGIDFSGHTEILAEFTSTSKVIMMLANKNLKVALATTHVPLSMVPSLITREHLCESLIILNNELKDKWGCKEPLIKVLGLNPHAGDGGYIGEEDKQIIAPTIKYLNAKGLNVVGPVSADTAYLKKEDEKVDSYLAMYHDQGLPVIKTSGFGNSVNITLGLPLIRTSVDHGTAYDKAGKKEVDETSLLEASYLAFKLAKQNQCD